MNNILYFNNFALFKKLDNRFWPRTNKKFWTSHFLSLFRGANPEDWYPRTNTVLNEDPWPRGVSPYLFPENSHTDLNFSDTFDTIAQELEHKLKSTGKTAYVFWSGGIDSTAILTAIIKNFNKETLGQVVVVLTEKSINEAEYFYYKFVHGKICHLHYKDLVIDSQFVKNALILDGEGGDQTFGSSFISYLTYANIDILNLPFNSQKDFFLNLWQTPEKPPGYANWLMGNIEKSIAASPWQLSTTYEVLWWWNFDGKWNNVMARMLPIYGKNLTPDQVKFMAKNMFFRFFEHNLCQAWSITTRQQRSYKSFREIKLAAKEYIYNFDKNPHYFYNKRKIISSTEAFNYVDSPYIAVDTEFNMYSFADRGFRQEIKKFLFE